MGNLNAEQIKKALECCKNGIITDCELCPRYNIDADTTRDCMEGLMRDAFNLIKSQEQRIKELTEENAEVKANWQKLKESHERACEECRAEFKRLTEVNDRLRDNLDRTEKALITMDKAHNNLFTDSFRIEAEAKADTVQKIAGLLWQGESEKMNISVGGKYYSKQEFIDQLAKELTLAKEERDAENEKEEAF